MIEALGHGIHTPPKQGMEVPPGSLVLGIPGKIVREGDESLRAEALKNARTYQELARQHKAGMYPQHGSKD